MRGTSVGIESDAEGAEVGVRSGGNAGEGGNDIERLDASAVAGGIDNIRSWTVEREHGQRAQKSRLVVYIWQGPHQFAVLARVAAFVLIV